MLNDVYQETEERMEKAISALIQELNTIRTGRANPSLVELLPIEYYGTQTPLQELATISVPESRSLLIRPYDPSSLKNIEKAILKSDLGLMPNNDGENIRLVLPTPTEERRLELVKVVGVKAEEARIAIRNIRRESIRNLRDFEDEKLITEDDLHRGEEKVQEITDDLKGRIRSRYVITNMVKEERKPAVIKRLSELALEYIADIPYDSKLEDWIYEGKALSSLEDSPVLDSIEHILSKIGGSNDNS